ncbi:MAG: hypothetical protein M1835_003910, partial [Candelina submexicana]
MADLNELVYLVARQMAKGGNSSKDTPTPDPAPGTCDTGNRFDGRLGLRISAIFVILLGSLF